MKKLLVITSAALIGLVSQATAALTVMSVGASDLATELRSLSKTDWATALGANMLSTSVGNFSRNDGADDGEVTINAGTTVHVESIFKDAGFVNDFGVVVGDGLGATLLTNLNLNESKKITSDSSDTQWLGFDTDVGGSNSKSAGAVTSADNDNVWTFTAADTEKSYFLWFLEDIDAARPRDGDFNDFIVLGTISAVPEPSTIISLIAVGFLGFVTWRNRRKAKA